VDSGSTDGTRESCLYFPVPVTLIKATPDDWWSAANNLGIKRAMEDGCEILLTINDDAIILDDYLEKFITVFSEHHLRICANRIDFAHEPGKVWALGSFSTFSSPFLFQLKYNGYWFNELPDEITHNEILPTMAVCGDGVLIHKNVFEEIGLFQETFTPHAHGDSEFSMRAQKHGIPIYVSPNVVLYNDVFNLSEQDHHPGRDNRTLCQKIRDVFFSKKSDCYWKPVLYVVFKYSPPIIIFSTVIKFFLWKIYTLFLADFVLKIMLPNNSEKNLHSKLTFLIKNISRKILRRLGYWVFDIKKYDNHTSLHIINDEKLRSSINQMITKMNSV
jgi:hypothetical protein